MEKDMEQVMKKAEVLIEALPYIQKFNRKIIVVKYGGSAMSNEELQKNVIKDVTLLKLVGFSPSSFTAAVRRSAAGSARSEKRQSSSTVCVSPMRRPWRSRKWY